MGNNNKPANRSRGGDGAHVMVRPPPQAGGGGGTMNRAVTRSTGSMAGQGGGSPGQRAMHVRCPTCTRTLVMPGTAHFLCPCGQMLQRPGGASASPAPASHPTSLAGPSGAYQQSAPSTGMYGGRAPGPAPMQTVAAGPLRVRCPRCRTLLEAPPGAPVFACPCGLHLSPPTTQASSRMPASSPFAGGGARPNPLLPQDSTLALEAILRAANSGTSNTQTWRHRVLGKGRDAKLGWKLKWSEAEDSRVLDAESVVMNALTHDALESMSVEEIRDRLSTLEPRAAHSQDKDALIQMALNAVANLASKQSEKDLRLRLEMHGLDDSACTTRTDLAQRLFCVLWSQGATVRGVTRVGYVRLFVGDSLEFVNASTFEMSTTVPLLPDLTADAIFKVSQRPFKVKCAWFKSQTELHRTKWDQGHVRMRIRRSHLLEDSFKNILQLQTDDMRRYFRFEFINEPAVDAGGVAREWFNLVTDTCFNVDFGLFEYGGTDNVCYQIASTSGTANENHLQYFKFLGRVFGKALFDQQQISPHLTRAFYKHVLAWPISEADVEFVDAQVSKSIADIQACEDVSLLCLTFTTTTSVFGEMKEHELKPGGAEIDVTNENRDEYLDLLMKYIMLGRVAKQTKEFLSGLYEVIPIPLLSVFDYNELELLLCGLPDIDVDDWQRHTKYKGEYAALGVNHPTIQMFWTLMRSMSVDQRARLLQFATGTSRVPVTGFAALQGNDGNVKNFTIDSIKLSESVFPKAHTCFNRIELPPYSTIKEMQYRLEQALQMEGTGFAIE